MIDQEKIKQILRSYKSNQASKYIPVRGDEILTKVFDCEKYSISTKYDGHLCFIIKENGEIRLLNFNGEPFDREDIIDELNNLLDKEGILVGEIFNYKENERTRSFDLVKNLKNNDSSIKIVVFDVINYDGTSYEKSLWDDKKQLIDKLFSNGKNIFSIEDIEVTSRRDIQTEFEDRVTNNNQEGLIVRGFNGPIFKIKPKLTFDFVVLGYSLGFSDNFNLLKELLFGIMIEKNEYLIIGKVSGGFTIEQRTSLLEGLQNLKVESNLIEPSGSKTPFTFIKPEKVIEVESVDIVNNTSDQIIKKSLVKFDKNKYLKINYIPSVSLISPVFKGLRNDKKVQVDQVGISQITRIIELENETLETLEKLNSKVLKKEIYYKVTKGLKMVKKYFVWETNTTSVSYPKYVFYKIDYSPTRGDKLQRDIKVSNNQDQITKIFSEQIEKDIKKGWVLYEN
ncbi:MAG: hypothetical protein L7S44_05105 [Flavobacteriaceae bacterium]|nr:hypothetical protein [Flavobacteriaceae bacterium]